jgi:hypothetical protein
MVADAPDALAARGGDRPADRVPGLPTWLRDMKLVLVQQGRGALEKALRSLERRLAEHVSKIDAARASGGYTSSMEREVQNFRELIAAAKQVLGKW